MPLENEQPHIQVDFDDYSIRGFRLGASWCIRSRAQHGGTERNFLVTGEEIQDAIVTELEGGPPHVRADSCGVNIPDNERQAILEAVERWQEFVVHAPLG